ncbi:hypothetical protein NIA69_11220 [Gemmiger formicilis]|nr:hypothetical protein [Gemmiger formicilis]
MIPTHDVNASLELEESFISECNFSNRLISLGSDAILTNNAEIAVSNPYMSTDNIKKLGRVRVTVSGNLVVETNSSARCDYKMVVEGVFSTGKTKDDEEFGKLLWINGTSVLYGIVRAKWKLSPPLFLKAEKSPCPLSIWWNL